MCSGALEIPHTNNFRNKMKHFTHSLKLCNEAKQTFQIQISNISKYFSISPCINKKKNDTLKTKDTANSSFLKIFHVHGKLSSQKVMKNRIQTKFFLFDMPL